jgi:hypothetical protein
MAEKYGWGDAWMNLYKGVTLRDVGVMLMVLGGIVGMVSGAVLLSSGCRMALHVGVGVTTKGTEKSQALAPPAPAKGRDCTICQQCDCWSNIPNGTCGRCEGVKLDLPPLPVLPQAPAPHPAVRCRCPYCACTQVPVEDQPPYLCACDEKRCLKYKCACNKWTNP